MHETSLATRVVATAVGEARRRALRQVRTVRVRLGALWGIEPASFEFQASLLAQGTPLEGARLTLDAIPAVARCQSCGLQVKDPRLNDPGYVQSLAQGALLLEASLSCSECGASAVTIEQGRELEVVEVAA